MGVILDRVSVLRTYLLEMVRHGLPDFVRCGDREIIMLLDGVGGFQFIPLLARKVIREANAPISSTWFRWQVPIPGLMLVDLMWRSRNQRSAQILADKLVALHRENPQAKIHIISYSGGTAVAVFALELLGGRVPIETLLLFAPAISPTYNLAPAIHNVKRVYVMMSCKDTWLLGAGTRLFGTMDRKWTRSAGLVGFRLREDLSEEHREAYQRIQVIEWCEEFRRFAHRGGHTGWAQIAFLRQHLLGLLAGTHSLPARPLDLPAKTGKNLIAHPSLSKREGQG